MIAASTADTMTDGTPASRCMPAAPASSAPKNIQVGPAVSYAVGQGATMVSALWGVLVWKEFAGASPKARVLLTLMFVLFLAGLMLVAIAPLYAR